ncbi:MAG TPA: RodZ domain-containing protein [Anaerolineales bacterium]|nr:RodZ domain-containing protein [Anaerolineales bacterium]
MAQTLGEQLRQARQERDLTLEQAARATHIRQNYLEALEAGELDRLPSRVQARGFLRAYASYLGLNPGLLPVGVDGEEKTTPLGAHAAGPSSVSDPDLTSEQVQSIFTAIGQTLQGQRETLGFSLEEVERNTRIKRHYLAALESGDLNGLPSPVQGRGMLYNYATFLGIDPDPLLLRFADGLQVRLAERQSLRTPSRSTPSARQALPSPVRRWISFDFMLGGVLIALLAGFVIWGAIRITALRSVAEPVVTVPSIAEELLSTPVGTPEFTPGANPSPTQESQAEAPAVVQDGGQPEEGAVGEVTPGAGLPTDSGALVQVYISVLQRAWMRVTVDGEVEFEGRVVPGSAYGFDGELQVELLTGNGAALQVFFNQTDLGVIGEYGEVVFRVFTPQGLAEPTPTITPTPTLTPLVSATPQATATVPPTPAP